MTYRGCTGKNAIPKDQPNFNLIVDCIANYIRKDDQPQYGRYGAPTSETVSEENLTIFKTKMQKILSTLAESETPIYRLTMSMAHLSLQIDESGVTAELNIKGECTRNHFNTTSSMGAEAAERAVDLIAALGSSLQYVSDRSIRKFLKGEVNMPTDDYIKLLRSQSLQNRVQKGGR